MERLIEKVEELRKKQNFVYEPILVWKKHKPVDWSDLLYKGIEINPDEITVCPDGIFEYEGFKVLVYIRDHFHHKGNEELRKFHISECQTIKKMKKNNRYNSRYVVTNRKDGQFKVRINNKESMENLSVCKKCLHNLDYKGYRSLFAPKKAIFKSFSIPDFFSQYKGIQDIPPHTETTAPVNDYPHNMDKISKKYRESRNWKCEECEESFENDKGKLHTHHLDGNRANNDPTNLKALCTECHSKQPFHSHMRGGNTEKLKPTQYNL